MLLMMRQPGADVNPIVSILVILIVLILIFLALREFVCWYYKINKRIELMEETNQLLKKLIMKSPEEVTSDSTSHNLK
jgi:hypothetical protein